MHLFSHEEIPDSPFHLFKYNRDKNMNKQTRSSNKLRYPSYNTIKYGKSSLRHKVSKIWNEFIDLHET